MYRIRRFGVVRTATIAALMYAVIVIVFFAVAAVFVLLFGAAAGDIPGAPGGFGPAFGAIGALGLLFIGLLVALFYAAIGWVFTAIACLVYNLVAGWAGGIEVEVHAVAPPSTPAAWPSAATPHPPGSPATPTGP